MYSVKQITNILMDAAERCNWKNLGFSREPFSVSVTFGDSFMPLRSDEKVGFSYHSYSANAWCYRYFDGKDAVDIKDQEEWLKEVDRNFWTICGVHLDMNAAENKTAACGD